MCARVKLSKLYHSITASHESYRADDTAIASGDGDVEQVAVRGSGSLSVLLAALHILVDKFEELKVTIVDWIGMEDLGECTLPSPE